MPARIASSDRPAAKLDADVAIAAERARARQDEIAEPAETGERFAPAAHRARQPRDLRQAARDERRERVVPETQRLDDARGDRDDVLQRGADFDAGDVIGRVEPEGRTAQTLPAPAARPARSDEAATSAVGSRRATSAAKLGPDSTTTGCAPCGFGRHDLGHPRQRVRLDAFGRAHEHGAGRKMRRGRAHHQAKSVRRHRHDDQTRAGQRVGERGRRPYGLREREIRQVRGIGATRGHLGERARDRGPTA